LIRKLDQKVIILTFVQFDHDYIGQLDLNTSNLISGFFIDYKVIFFTSQIKPKNWATKKFEMKNNSINK
jgi:hypothetical protein